MNILLFSNDRGLFVSIGILLAVSLVIIGLIVIISISKKRQDKTIKNEKLDKLYNELNAGHVKSSYISNDKLIVDIDDFKKVNLEKLKAIKVPCFITQNKVTVIISKFERKQVEKCFRIK